MKKTICVVIISGMILGLCGVRAEASEVTGTWQWYWGGYTMASALYGTTYCKWDTGLTDGTYLSYCLNDNLAPEGIMMLLDFGYYTEYVDTFKAKGLIPSNYQLPTTFYTMKKIPPYFQNGVYKASFIETECPELLYVVQEEYNSLQGVPYVYHEYTYTPKYIRDAMKP